MAENNSLDKLTEIVEASAKASEKNISIQQAVAAAEEKAYDDVDNTELRVIPTPNFSDAKSVGTVLPINMVSEIVNNLSKISAEIDLVEYVRIALNYASRIDVVLRFSSEQVDALAMAITQFEMNNAFILGDMAGIGKGRVCAGVLRYAYQKGFTPIFITHKPYLFSDIYRDLIAIGGFGQNKNKLIEPIPFILNDSDPEESSVRDYSGNVVYKPLKSAMTTQICESLKLPKQFNCVFLSYSQLANVRKETKQNFLEAIAPESILVFDESHNAASANEAAKVLTRSLSLIQPSKGVLFSSATYAKNPDVFGLYVVKTSLRSAVPDLSVIGSALKVGGENVAEYIASGLAKEGQYIRRDRSFGNVKKTAKYVQDENQRRIFNEAIGYFKELRDFTKTDLCRNAVYNSILRRCEELGKEIVAPMVWEEIKNLSTTVSDFETRRNNFIRNNRNKWILVYDKQGSIAQYKATFRENLFLAVKAKYTADEIISTLNNSVTYENADGTIQNTPQKPIIAIRSTGEAIFNLLDLNEGDEIDNDFADYLRAVYYKIFKGNFTLRKVDANIFQSVATLKGAGVEVTQERYEYLVSDEDFADGGAQITDIQSRLRNYSTLDEVGNPLLPMSIIDYLRTRITETERSRIYFNSDGAPKYNNNTDSHYTFNEATGREFMLKKEGERYVLRKNERIRSTTRAFKAFNNGVTDVLLINVAASTGGSAQSSPNEGMDTRQRNMFIIQFELDVNVEVQKRGRVNRTGQLNLPEYTYVISKIPVELRSYLMFRKKLRKLDANTSANQLASSQTSEIEDAQGNAIQDIYNHYGFETFIGDFINLDEFRAYSDIFDEVKSKSRTPRNTRAEGEAEAEELNINQFSAFVRELELYDCDFQEVFFNEMNVRYINHIETLKATNNYQAELTAKNYKASIKQRVVIKLNSGTTTFSMPLFLEDNYVLEENRAWSKDRVQELSRELRNGLPINEYHVNLLDDYNTAFTQYKTSYLNTMRINSPIRQEFSSEETYTEALEQYNTKILITGARLDEQKNQMKNMIQFFSPERPVSYEGYVGKFVGFKLKDTSSRFKYSHGSVEFIFCFLNRYPILHLKLTTGFEMLERIKASTQLVFSGGANNPLGEIWNTLASNSLREVTDWRPDMNKRLVKRFLSGNILAAIVDAKVKADTGQIQNFKLERFTNIDNSISTAVELKYGIDLSETDMIYEDTTTLSVATNNENFINFVSQMPLSYRFEDGSFAQNNTFPIWDENARVCILKIQDENDGDKTKIFVNITGLTKRGSEEPNSSTINYNPIYDWQGLLRYQNYTVSTPNGDRETIQYYRKITKEKFGKVYRRTIEQGQKTLFLKKLVFNLDTDRQAIKELFDSLYEAFELNMNFKSSADDYYFIERTEDIYPELLRTQQLENQGQKDFEEGEYEYSLFKNLSDKEVELIPNFIERTYRGTYGGVILSKPLKPSLLPSYSLKPYNLSNKLKMQLLLSELNAPEKKEFISQAKNVAESESDIEIGRFVDDYIRKKSVPALYFFGDMRLADYGNLVKNFIREEDIENLTYEQPTTENISSSEPPKTIPTFEDSENFLIYLL
jgi:hypothetical protein